jgi:hypothetical protein
MTQEISTLRQALMPILDEYETEQGCSSFSAMRDLLIDIRHICDEKEIDYHVCQDASYGVYLEEKQDYATEKKEN